MKTYFVYDDNNIYHLGCLFCSKYKNIRAEESGDIDFCCKIGEMPEKCRHCRAHLKVIGKPIIEYPLDNLWFPTKKDLKYYDDKDWRNNYEG